MDDLIRADETAARPHGPLAIAEPVTAQVFTTFAPVLDAWAELEAIAPAPLYQTRRFAIPWHATMGEAAEITPFIVLICDAASLPLALFPLGLRESHGVRRIEFLGGKVAIMGLFRPGFQPDGESLRRLLQEAARASALSPDCFALSNQPESWDYLDNPMAQLPHQRSPSLCHSARLMADSEAFHKQQLSGDARKKMRYKRRKLEELGAVSLLTARTTDEAERLLDAFFEQKRQRFDDKNISNGFDSPQARAFFARCCVSRIGRRDASVELHGLLVGERIVATYGGGVHRGRFHGMINSFDQSPEIARNSPGDLLLSLLIESKCRQGLQCFDLGIGESRYKSTWCDHAEPLFDTLLPLTLKGSSFVVADALRRRAKRLVKQTPWAWKTAQWVREKMRALR